MRFAAAVWTGVLLASLSVASQDRGGSSSGGGGGAGVNATVVKGTGAVNPVDHVLDAKWKDLKLTPNKRSTDEEFLRRVTLDLVGNIPKPEEVVEFTSSKAPNKREQVIDRLMASDMWAEYWADRLTSLLIGYRDQRVDAVVPMKEFLREHLRKNTPYHQLVESMITAKGSNKEEKATTFMLYWIYKDRSKKELTVQISKVFLGLQLQCAQCHDHPFEKWTKDDFYSMVANFASTRVNVVNKATNPRDSEYEVLDGPGGNKGYMPEGYKISLKPKFIDGQPLNPTDTRREFSKLLTGPENLQFARATVNRFWSILIGVGFVEPVDDFGTKNPPAMRELLDEVSRQFIESNCDLKWLMRTIVTSKAYQLSSRHAEKEGGEEAKKYFARAVVRPMSPEQQLNVIARATGTDEAPKGFRGVDPERIRRQLMNQMVMLSGQDTANSPSEYNASVQQIMRMLNIDAPAYRGIKVQGGGAMSHILKTAKNPEDFVTQIYLRTVSRFPTRDEVAHCVKYLKAHQAAPEAYEDIYFVLLNTNEFFFNH